MQIFSSCHLSTNASGRCPVIVSSQCRWQNLICYFTDVPTNAGSLLVFYSILWPLGEQKLLRTYLEEGGKAITFCFSSAREVKVDQITPLCKQVTDTLFISVAPSSCILYMIYFLPFNEEAKKPLILLFSFFFFFFF